MKNTFLFLVIACLWLAACGPAQPPLQKTTPIALAATQTGVKSTVAPAISPSPLPSATAPVPNWKIIPLIDAPSQVVFPNDSADYQGKDIFNSGVVLETDTRWTMDVQVDKLTPDVGEASTGFRFNGATPGGIQQTLVLVYQGGFWSIGYYPNSMESAHTYWQAFDRLTNPSQHFNLIVSRDGKQITLTNDAGFEFQQTLDLKLFDGAQVISTSTQIGPHTKITITKLVIGQLQTNQVANAPGLPADFLTPTTQAPGNRAPAYTFHVAVGGNDANPGTPDRPFATLQHARDVIRTINANMPGSIVVTVHGGVYPISHPVQFAVEDSGQNGFDVIYRAAQGETPILSGGVAVTGWEKVPGSQLWKTVLPDVDIFRQLYVNGLRAPRAASLRPVAGMGWAAGETTGRDGIRISASQLPDILRPQDLELHWIYDWNDMRLPVKDIQKNADGTKTIWMKQPYFSYALGMGNNDHQWYPKFDVPFYLENAFELLDVPGEWYDNPDTHELFYLPLAGEDMATASVIVPQTQTLLEITGGMVGKEVHNLIFDGLSFEYAAWTRASERGTFGWQAQNLIVSPALPEEMTPAHVQVNSAHDITFERCRFEHLGAVGLDLNNNVYHVTVQGNLFHDISDGAIVIGSWKDVYITTPSTQVAPHDDLIANNLIQDVGAEYWGAPAITAYYVNNMQIVHNEIANVPYTGISVGWGWSSATDSTTAHDNHVANNLIMDLVQRARDAGGIYTLGQQPGTTIEGNVIRRMKADYACFYTDEGSAFMTLRNNVCDTAPQWAHIWINTIHDNQISNTYTNVRTIENNGKNIKIDNTVYVNGQAWPPAAQAIIANAGLEAAYAYLHEWLNHN